MWTLIKMWMKLTLSHHDIFFWRKPIELQSNYNIRIILGTFEEKNTWCDGDVHVTYFSLTCLASYISHTPVKDGLPVQLWKLQQKLVLHCILAFWGEYSWTTHWSGIAIECQYKIRESIKSTLLLNSFKSFTGYVYTTKQHNLPSNTLFSPHFYV